MPKLTSGSSMFYGCMNLNSFRSNLPIANNFYYTFAYCNNLNSVDLGVTLNTGTANIEQMFYVCGNLRSIANFNLNNFFGYNLYNDPGVSMQTFRSCTNFPGLSSMHQNWR
jgi:hypothetical protein